MPTSPSTVPVPSLDVPLVLADFPVVEHSGSTGPSEDSALAIPGALGHLVVLPDHRRRLPVLVLARSPRHLGAILRHLRDALSLTIAGDREAIGTVPPEAIPLVARVLRLHRRPPHTEVERTRRRARAAADSKVSRHSQGPSRAPSAPETVHAPGAPVSSPITS